MNTNNCLNCESYKQTDTYHYCTHKQLMIAVPESCEQHSKTPQETPALQVVAEEFYEDPQIFAGDQYACDPWQWM